MRLRTLMGPVAAVGLLLAPAAVLADDTKKETTDMPATEHQEQVIEGQVESDAQTEAQGEVVEGMPATKHQKEVLEDVAPAAGPENDDAQQDQGSAQ